jgi:predicted NAD/FAD-dependent oxidoreductase
MSSVAIIGAGVSGLAAAHILQDAGYAVTLFEQANNPGGRATTRKRDGFIFDPGAQYIKQGTPDSISFITERFSTPDLIDIAKPVWTFDGAGHIQEGDPVQNAGPKWNYRHGLCMLAKRIGEGLDIRFETHIAHVQQTRLGWNLYAAPDQLIRSFEYLLIAIPAPAASALIQASHFTHDIRTQICSLLDTARYNPLISVALGYRPRPSSRPYYALVNTDRQHSISWLAWEHEKAPERAPVGTGMLIAQMAPQYSAEHRDTPAADLIPEVAERVKTLIDEDLPFPFFTDIQRWPSALPSQQADAENLNALTLPYGLAFCGDTFVGGRVHLAIEHGIMVAGQFIGKHARP